jgi:mevalonate kinase
MEQKEDRFFPGKLILFGEHTVVYGGQAIALPTPQYGGRWIAGGNQTHQTDFFAFIDYLRIKKDELKAVLDLDRLQWDIDSGWIFESNIPGGAGLGSSGAFTAAIYHTYGSNYPQEIVELKADLALIESYFHGQSSGLDPLISYINEGILLQGDQIKLLDNQADLMDHFTLINTQMPRDGKFMIQQYATHWAQAAFRQQIETNYLPMVDACINAYLADDAVAMNTAMFDLSYFQLVHLNFLIPSVYIRNWEERLMFTSGYFKICGAGGGGFLLRYDLPD